MQPGALALAAEAKTQPQQHQNRTTSSIDWTAQLAIGRLNRPRHTHESDAHMPGRRKHGDHQRGRDLHPHWGINGQGGREDARPEGTRLGVRQAGQETRAKRTARSRDMLAVVWDFCALPGDRATRRRHASGGRVPGSGMPA